jgi:hypothetical protein
MQCTPVVQWALRLHANHHQLFTKRTLDAMTTLHKSSKLKPPCTNKTHGEDLDTFSCSGYLFNRLGSRTKSIPFHGHVGLKKCFRNFI